MTIRTRETRIKYKELGTLLEVGVDRARAQFVCIRLFAKKTKYSYITYGDYVDWLGWYNTHTPEQRKDAYKVWKKEIEKGGAE